MTLLALAAALSLVHAGTREELVVLHTNDIHGHLRPHDVITRSGEVRLVGGAEHLAARIAQERSRHPGRCLVLDAGDTLSGAPVSDATRGAPSLAVLNEIAPDAWALGNHEFDWGVEVLRQRIGEAQFPVLCANLRAADGSLFPGVRDSLRLRRGGVEILLVGVVTPDTPGKVRRGATDGVRFSPPADSVRRAAAGVGREVLLVVLSHLGLEDDRDLARDVPEIDLIVGGHSHTPLFEPERVGTTLIVQAGSHGRWLGFQKLEVDAAAGEIVRWTRRNALREIRSGGDGVARVREIVAAAWTPLAARFEAPICELAKALVRVRDDGESSLGNMVCDAFRDATKCDLALMNAGGLRADLPSGPLRVEQLHRAIPFENELLTFEATGDAILSAFERSAKVSRGPLQLSGGDVVYDFSRPAGERVVSLRIGGERIDVRRTYRVTTVDYLVGGSSGLRSVAGSSPARIENDYRELVAAYLRAHSPYEPPASGRIRIEGRGAPSSGSRRGRARSAAP